jgi:colanic acid biosynthesis glycosyl transferase WcaI
MSTDPTAPFTRSEAGEAEAGFSPTPGLRIAIVTQYFWPEEFRINDLAWELVRRGHEVQVLTGHPNYPSGHFFPGYGGLVPRTEEATGAKLCRVPLLPRKRGTGPQLLLNYLSFAASASLFGPGMVRGQIDVVLAFEPSPVTVAAPALSLARVKRAPALMWVQDLWPDTLGAMGVLAGRLQHRAALLASSALHRALDGHLVQSRGYLEPLRAQGVASARLSYVPNWAEEFYRPVVVPDDAPQRLEMPDGLNILFAGNLGVSQGLDVVLGAAERLADVDDLHWVFLGTGRQERWLRDQVTSRGLADKVHLLGRRPVTEMPTWFALADVLLASLKPEPVYRLTLPSKLQTYLACGKPILASLDGEGARVVEESGAGLVVPAGDPSALASAARRLLLETDAGHRAEMGRRGLAYAREHFDRVRVIDRIEGLLHDAVAQRTGGDR